MSKAYDYYIAHGGPLLPKGYSFEVEADRYLSDVYVFRIVGPPRGPFRTRRREYLCDRGTRGRTESGRGIMWQVSKEDRRVGAPAPEAWFAWVFREVYGSWRAVTHEVEMHARWDANLGLHP